MNSTQEHTMHNIYDSSLAHTEKYGSQDTY